MTEFFTTFHLLGYLFLYIEPFLQDNKTELLVERKRKKEREKVKLWALH